MIAVELTLTNVRDFLVGVAALITALAVIARPFLAALDRRVRQLVEPIVEKLEDIEADVADVRHEVNTNNGRSLKDVALRTSGEVETLRARFDDHLKET